MKSNPKRLTSCFIFGMNLLTISITALSPISAHALMAPTGMPSGVGIVNCNNFCPMFGAGAAASLKSADQKWGSIDNSLCTELGAPTVAGALAPTPTPSAHPSYAASGCNIPLTQSLIDNMPSGIGQNASDLCQQANVMLQHCAYHNSQVENYCMMFNAIMGSGGTSDQYGNYAENSATGFIGAKKYNQVLLGLDLAAATACLTACILPIPPTEGICTAAGLAAGGAEIAAIIQMQNSQVQGYIAAAAGGAGTLGAIGTAVSGGMQAKNSGKDMKALTEKVMKKGSTEAVDDAARGLSCATAALFAITSGIRAYNINEMNNAAANACTQVNNLMSSGSNVGYTGSSGGNTYNGGSGTNSSTSSSTTGSSSGTGTTGTITGSDVGRVLTCGNNTSLCTGGNGSGMGTYASDGNLLNRAGINPQNAQQIPDLNPIVDKASREGAAAALGAMAPAGAGQAAEAIQALAKMAQENPTMFSGDLNVAANYSNGGGASAASANPMDSLNNLFGNSGGAGGPGGAGKATMTQFGQPTQDANDIWHRNSKSSIFDIISSKILNITNRITQ